jgi:hypothetical protein
MKAIAAASFYFESQTENAYAAAYNSDRRPGALIGIQFRARKLPIDEPIIERL